MARRSIARIRLALIAGSLLACGTDPPRDVRGTVSRLEPARLRIVEIYAGGGNTGAAYARDYVIVGNVGGVAASTDGLSLQYTSGSGTSTFGATESTRTPMPSLVIPPGGFVSVAGASLAAVGAALPSVDVEDASPLALATSGGRLVLVQGNEPLACNGASSPCDAAQRARVLDLVGWGNAAYAEGEAAPSMGNAEALARLGGGCTDTDDNRADFALVGPGPRGTNAPIVPCSADEGDAGPPAPQDGGAEAGSDAMVAADAAMPTLDGGAAVGDAGDDVDGGIVPTSTPAHVQGERHRAPLEGQRVEGIEGVVTLVAERRFFLQGAPDADPRTSDAIAVEIAGASPVGLGMRVRVRGTVRERTHAAFGDASRELTVTTLVSDGVDVLGIAPVPAPRPIEDGTLPRSIAATTTPLDLETRGPLDPARSRIEALEALEGMRVRLPRLRVLSATRGRGDGLRELVAIDDAAYGRLDDGRLVDPELASRWILVESAGVLLPHLDPGDTLDGPIDGVVDYERGRYVLRLSAHGGGRSSAPPPAVASLVAPLRIATFNLHGLDAGEPSSRFAAIADAVVHTLDAPELLALQELGDDSGVVDDGVVVSDVGERMLVDAILARSGPAYDVVALPPSDGRDGGEPGRNVRVALAVRRDAGFAIVRRGVPGGEARIRGRGTSVQLVDAPARVGLVDPAFEGGRKPLVVELARDGRTFFVVVVHLRSRLADPPLEGRVQPASAPSDVVRLAEAERVAAFVESVLSASASASIVVLGDANETADRPARLRLARAGLWDAFEGVSSAARTTYVYEGVASGIDTIALAPGLVPVWRASEVVHACAGRGFAPSDHDPALVGLALPRGEPSPTTPAGCALVGAGATRAASSAHRAFLAAFLGLVGLRVRGRRQERVRRAPGPHAEGRRVVDSKRTTSSGDAVPRQ